MISRAMSWQIISRQLVAYGNLRIFFCVVVPDWRVCGSDCAFLLLGNRKKKVSWLTSSHPTNNYSYSQPTKEAFIFDSLKILTGSQPASLFYLSAS